MSNNTLSTLKEIFSEVLLCSPDELILDKPYVDMGVDSILAMQISKLILIKFDREILSSELFNFISITELAKYIDNDNSVFNVVKTEHKDSKEKRDRNNVKDKVAIIGISGKYPKSKNIREFWNNIINSKNTISTSSEKKRGFKKEYFGSFLDDIKSFDNDFFNISPKEAKLMDPQQRIMMEVAFNAFDDAGINIGDLYNSNCGVVTTSLPGDYKYKFDSEAQKYNNFGFLGNAVSVLSGRISHFFNLKGPSLNIDSACSSSLVAIDLAIKYLLSGVSDTFLVGASSVFSTEELFKLAESVNIISKNGVCRPFDEEAKGFIPAEAVSCIVLKRLSDVDIKNHKLYGIIEGISVNHDGLTNGIMSPNYQSQKELIINIYKKNNIGVSNVALVECHGTGTRIGDPIEIKALREAYESLGEYSSYLNSCKANIGHSLVASGLTSLIKMLMCFEEELIPKQINFNKLNHEIDLGGFNINTDCISWPKEKKFGAISAFGFGGTNAHIVVSKPDKIFRSNTLDDIPYIFLFSAKNSNLLHKQLQAFIYFLEESKDVNFEDLSYSQNCRRNHFICRIVLIAQSKSDLKQKIQKFLDSRSLPKYSSANITIWEALDFLTKNKFTTGDSTYLKMLEKLAEEISTGKNFEYEPIYSDNVHKIPIPEYQYENKVFWLPEGVDADFIERDLVDNVLQISNNEINTILIKLKSIISEKLGYKPEEIALDKPLNHFGVDSIIALQILDSFSGQYYINDSSIIFNAVNISDLANKIFNFKNQALTKSASTNVVTSSHQSFQKIKYHTILDKNIEWFIFGEYTNKSIILLPPLNTLFHVWIQQIKFLIQIGYSIYIPHYPGHGNSKLFTEINLESLSRVLAINFKNISGNIENVDIVGWSLGGCLGILLSLQKQVTIDKLILVNCLPKFNQDIFGQSLELRNELLENKDYLTKLYGETKHNVIDFISANCTIDTLKDYYSELQKYDVTNSLSKIASKTLVILGEKDLVIEKQEAERFGQIESFKYQTTKNGGHFVPLTQPFLFNQLLKNFLGE